MNYYIEVGGGLGDLAYQYFTRPEFGRLESFKRANPDCFIRVINRNVNSSAQDFFSYNPFINQHVFVPFTVHSIGDPACCAFSERLKEPYCYETKRPKIYLAEPELRLLEIVVKHPTVIVHPSTWDKSRSMIQFLSTEFVAKAVVGRGFYPVVVGGTCRRTDNGLQYVPEKWDDFGDLTGTSCRVAIAAITKATAVIGAHSFACCTANALGIPFRAYVAEEHHALWGVDDRVWHPSCGDPKGDLLRFLGRLDCRSHPK